MRKHGKLNGWLFAGFLLLAMAAQAGDWPQYLGPNREPISRETGLLKSWPTTGLKVLWEAPVGAGFSAVSIAKGRVFTMGERDGAQWVLAYDEKTGQELWKVRAGDKFAGSTFPGPRSTPTVDGDRVYAYSGEGNIFCLEAATGKIRWQKNPFWEFKANRQIWGVAMSPLVDGKYLYVNGGEAKGAAVIAYDKLTGEILWKSQDGPAGYSSPQVKVISGKRQVVFFGGSALFGLQAETGKLLWQYPWTNKAKANAAMPIVKGDFVFISSAYGTGCALLKIDLKATSPTRLVYKSQVMHTHWSSPILIGDYVYGFDDFQLRCCALMTGQFKWEVKDFGKGNLLVADGLVYILTEKGDLVLGKLSPEKFEKISEMKSPLGNTKRAFTMPVIANGRIYLRNETKLVCLDIKAK